MENQLAVECFADEIVGRVILAAARMSPTIYHAGGKARVANAVFRDGKCPLGMVDDDPGSALPDLLKRARTVQALQTADLRESAGRFIIVLKPRLEECHFTAMKNYAQGTTLASSPNKLHEILGTGRATRAIEQFQAEVEAARDFPGGYVREAIELLRALAKRTAS